MEHARNDDARELLAADLAALLAQLGIAAILRPGDDDEDASIVAGHAFVVEAVRQGPARRLGLTPRQSTIVGLIASGMTNRQIATRLGISLHTVRRHVEALFRRLDVSSRAAAAVVLTSQRRLPAS